jgi:hypothetical protein
MGEYAEYRWEIFEEITKRGRVFSRKEIIAEGVRRGLSEVRLSTLVTQLGENSRIVRRGHRGERILMGRAFIEDPKAQEDLARVHREIDQRHAVRRRGDQSR